MADVIINHSGAAPDGDATGSAGASDSNVITDARGRQLKLRELTLLQEQDLLVAIGPEHVANSLVLGRALMAARVAEIDGSKVRIPFNNREYRALLERVGKDGLAAVIAATMPPGAAEDGATDDGEIALAKN